jgi:uncharacterized Fe-S cluster protein YjdI
MAGLKKTYKKDNLSVIWQPDLCIHSTNCFKGLSGVFNPAQKPWINVEAASAEEIVNQIDKCPSGALSYRYENDEEGKKESINSNISISISDDGPILVNGPAHIRYNNKEEVNTSRNIALCRCGHSSNKPYCDGSHKKYGFKG